MILKGCLTSAHMHVDPPLSTDDVAGIHQYERQWGGTWDSVTLVGCNTSTMDELQPLEINLADFSGGTGEGRSSGKIPQRQNNGSQVNKRATKEWRESGKESKCGAR